MCSTFNYVVEEYCAFNVLYRLLRAGSKLFINPGTSKLKNGFAVAVCWKGTIFIKAFEEVLGFTTLQRVCEQVTRKMFR